MTTDESTASKSTASTESTASKSTASTESAASEAGSDLPHCRCGHTRKHHMVSAEPEYTLGGYLLLLLGVTVKPIKLKFRCRQCDTIFETTTNRDLIQGQI
ncbi:hypothetical protein [Chondromyces crocatus]|uniref:Uncharacterized protein n=1 Tax=Chondromyces crocatus TaxID=52 RepID=A0A0K1EPP9_CHOCO|nr:hypothetical protein [Chondromyces crocatus]AKT42900.1 uncharacterized protein CMC5_071280 [Chondromyces crocatus]